MISPILANVYLHYVFDLGYGGAADKAAWDMTVIRFADDTIVGLSASTKRKRSFTT